MVGLGLKYGDPKPDRRGLRKKGESMICDNCGFSFVTKPIVHTNICQEIKVHSFCTKECRNKWCHNGGK